MDLLLLWHSIEKTKSLATSGHIDDAAVPMHQYDAIVWYMPYKCKPVLYRRLWLYPYFVNLSNIIRRNYSEPFCYTRHHSIISDMKYTVTQHTIWTLVKNVEMSAGSKQWLLFYVGSILQIDKRSYSFVGGGRSMENRWFRINAINLTSD